MMVVMRFVLLLLTLVMTLRMLKLLIHLIIRAMMAKILDDSFLDGCVELSDIVKLLRGDDHGVSRSLRLQMKILLVMIEVKMSRL